MGIHWVLHLFPFRVMVASMVQSSPVQTSELSNEDTKRDCTQQQIRSCQVYLGAAVATCIGYGLVPTDPTTACAFAACVIAQVELADRECKYCVCEWIGGLRPR